MSHTALSVARIFFYLSVVGELTALYLWREVSFLPQHVWVSDAVLPAAIVAAALAAIGFRTRFATLLAFPLVFFVFHVARDQYHYDAIVENFCFVFLFAPAPLRLAVDASLRARFGDAGADAGDAEPPVPAPFVFLFYVALVLLYTGAIYYRFISDVWVDGTVLWLSATAPIFSTGRLPDLFAVPALTRVASYVAFAYELLFPLVIVRKLRAPLAVVGVGLHLGIAVLLPLPWFGLGLAGMVAAFLPWERLSRRRADESVAAERVVGFSRPRAVATLMVAAVLLSAQLWLELGLPRTVVHDVTGVSTHPIFWDWHFKLRRPALSFVLEHGGELTRLPSFDDGGRPEISSRYWTKLGFLMRSKPAWEYYVYRYVRGWSAALGVAPDVVHVYWKDVRLEQSDVEVASVERVRARPWEYAGSLRFGPDGELVASWDPAFLARFDPSMLETVKGGGGAPQVVAYQQVEAQAPLVWEDR
jgi:hypothetical protein